MKKRISDFILPLLCATFLVVFSLTLLFTPPKEYSEEENRVLTTAPTLTVQALLDGSYTRALGDYFADQFPLRTGFVRLKSVCERLLLRGENNGVLFGSDGYLIPRDEYTDAEYAALKRNVAAAATLAERLAEQSETAKIPLIVAPVPRSVDVNRTKLPAIYAPEAANTAWEVLAAACAESGLSTVDLRTPLQTAADDGSEVWFRTDHHWTSEGAYLAYTALGAVLGYQPYPRDAFTIRTLSTDFLGTTYSTAGLTAAQGDAITPWRYDGDTAYRTEIWENGATVRQMDGFYDTDALTGKDQYSVYLGGTHAHIRIEPPDGTTLPTLLLLKDSYAQSLAPFLARHYRLILIDPRSYRETDHQPGVLDLIAAEQPDAVLLLCGLDTLCGDVDLRTLLLQRR